MPICRDCQGTGQRDIKKEIMTRCPDCEGTKHLPDGTDCPRCDQWGEVGTGEYQIEKQLCKTCWGSGKVSQQAVTVWFLIRAIPTTLVALGLGGVAVWGSWLYLQSAPVTVIVLLAVLAIWGTLMYYFISHLPE